MRHTAVITVSVVVALATGAILAVTGGAQAPGGRTIALVSKSCQFKLTDVAPRIRGREGPPGAGDAFALSCRLTDAAGAAAGALDAQCEVTKGGRRLRGVCSGVYDLADGDLYLSARLTPEETTRGAVVGGTEAYAGARGTFTSVDRPGERGGDPSDETITLLP